MDQVCTPGKSGLTFPPLGLPGFFSKGQKREIFVSGLQKQWGFQTYLRITIQFKVGSQLPPN